MGDTLLTIFNIVTAVVALASVIAEITPTKKDDEILGKVKSVLSLLALRFSDVKNK